MLECTKKDKINFLISDSASLKDRGVFNKVIGNINFTGNAVGRSRNNLFTCLFLFVAEHSFNNNVITEKA